MDILGYCPSCGLAITPDYRAGTENDENYYLCSCGAEPLRSELKDAGRDHDPEDDEGDGYDSLPLWQQDEIDRAAAFSDRYDNWRNEY